MTNPAHAEARARVSVGAEPDQHGTLFRVWAPDHDGVEILIDERDGIPLDAGEGGYFSGHVTGVGHGARYRYRLADGTVAPDPASRWQPDGPHEASAVVDASRFVWTDDDWTGVGRHRHAIYEMHIGTFTPAGTWAAAADELPALAALGITIIEMMPIAEFPGRFNWGYDGVAPYAPAHVYGEPDDLRRFIDRAHGLGIAVILDVVYNHLGPDGCYLGNFARDYFSRRYTTDWGDAINFDDRGSAGVRAFFSGNAEYWIRDFHFDGLRLDATQDIHDAGSPHILAELTACARAAAGDRRIWIVAENEPQDARLVRPLAEGGHGMDAMWNDDFHHTAMVALTGRAEAYYTDYRGTPQEFISVARAGFLYQGQYYSWQRQRRGTPTAGVPAHRFVNFVQNHDQLANSADGRRLYQLASAGEARAMTALLLLLPGTAMLFQGQEFRASGPFHFFADHRPALAAQVHEGRRRFMRQFPSAATEDVQERTPDPAAVPTFLLSTLDHGERVAHQETFLMHRDLIHLARFDDAFARQDHERVAGAVLHDRSFVLRYYGDDGDDRLLLVNLGTQLRLSPAPEPLLAPPPGMRWSVLWSSDSPDYGGQGVVEPEQEDHWHVPGRAAVVLAPAAAGQP